MQNKWIESSVEERRGPGEAQTRRQSARARILTPIWLNKYIDGFPYLAELVDLSADGLLIRTTLEPDVDVESFSVELGIPGMANRIWLWARRVRREGKMEALKLFGTEMFDRAYLAQLTRWHSEAGLRSA